MSSSSKKSSSRRAAGTSVQEDGSGLAVASANASSGSTASSAAAASDAGGDESLDSRDQAKQRALNLLQQTLVTRTDLQGVPDIVAVVKEALGGAYKVENGRARRTPGKVSRHDEFCNICELGGDLLCCDTCSKVFHLNCIVPRLPAVPRGTWSCPSCIVQNIARGDSSLALLNLKKMQGNSKAAKTSSEQEFVVCFLDDGAIVIQKAASRYVVRLTHKYRAREIGRFYTLQEALEEASALKRGAYGDVRTVAASTAEGAGLRSSLVREAAGGAGADDAADEPLECSYCMDDPAIELCAFCGCVDCYGKTNTEAMLTCEECSVRRHIECITRSTLDDNGGAGLKQDSIAANSKKRRSALRLSQNSSWYCVKCSKDSSKSPAVNLAIVPPRDLDEVSTKGEVAASPASTPEGPKKKKKRTSGGSGHLVDASPATTKQESGAAESEGANAESNEPVEMEIATNDAGNNPVEEFDSGEVAEVVIPSVVNKETILGVLSVCRSRAMTDAESDIVSLFRRTAHIKDIEAVLASLKAEKNRLLKQ